MKVQAFPSGPFDTNAYVISCEITGEAAIVDPSPGCSLEVKNYLSKNQVLPKKIWLTHSHWDHIAETSILKKMYQIPVYVHILDAPNLENPGSDQLPCWISFEGVQPDGFLNDGDSMTVGQEVFTVIHTPGHTPGSLCLYNKEAEVLLSGDTLFQGTIGNLSFPTSKPKLMANSLEKLAKLPSQTLVYPGHGPSTTIGNESWLSKAKQIFNKGEFMGVLVGKPAPSFKTKAVVGDRIVENFSLSDFKGKYVIFFFYPLDFTFVCPTELHAFQERLTDFETRNAQVIACSVDSCYSHYAWLQIPKDKGGIQGVTYPIVADLNKHISRDYDVLNHQEGIAYRGLFLINKEGIVHHQIVNDLPLGRSVEEALRVLDALIYVEKYGEVCPANWNESKKSLRPTQEGLEEYFANR